MVPVAARVNHLIHVSQAAYRSGLEREANGEEKAQRILRVGINMAAHALEYCHAGNLVAGDYLQRHTFRELAIDDALGRWPKYKEILAHLPHEHIPTRPSTRLDEWSSLYSKVTRKTVNPDGSFESDAMHVVHMMSWALPYAATYHPNLDLSKIALYKLVHDFPEAFAGDVSSLGIDEPANSKKLADEADGWQRIKDELQEQHPRLVETYEAYEEQQDDESRYTKSCDKLDPKLNSLHTNGLSLIGYHDLSASRYEEIMSAEAEAMAAGYAHDYPDLVRIQQELVRRIIATTAWRKPS